MSQAQTLKTDIPTDSWVDRALPARLQPYARLMRLDRPIGTWLLLWPGLWALVLAGAGFAAWHFYFLFAIGAIVMRGAGCTYNDIIDCEIDAKVARTSTRPLPSGHVNMAQACLFLAVQLTIGLGILLQFNTFAVLVGGASLVLVFTYPFMKRITYWPQAWLASRSIGARCWAGPPQKATSAGRHCCSTSAAYCGRWVMTRFMRTKIVMTTR